MKIGGNKGLKRMRYRNKRTTKQRQDTAEASKNYKEDKGQPKKTKVPFQESDSTESSMTIGSLTGMELEKESLIQRIQRAVKSAKGLLTRVRT